MTIETGLSVKFDASLTEDGYFTGYGAAFNNVDEGSDVILPGAFAASLKKRGNMGVKMLWMHDPEDPIGYWEELSEDARGLKVKGRLLLSLQQAKEVYDMMKAGIIDSLSVGYRTVKSTNDAATSVRKLSELDLWEVSAVTFPMNSKAKIQAVKGIPTRKELEEALRKEAGLSHTAAAKAAAAVKYLLRNGDDEPAASPRNEVSAAAFNGAFENLIRSIRS